MHNLNHHGFKKKKKKRGASNVGLCVWCVCVCVCVCVHARVHTHEHVGEMGIFHSSCHVEGNHDLFSKSINMHVCAFVSRS